MDGSKATTFVEANGLRDHEKISMENTIENSSNTEPVKRHSFFKCLNVSTMEVISKFLAEVIGTALLLLVGCSSGLAWQAAPADFICGLMFGFVVMMLIQCFGKVSGAHLNPAVTLSAVLNRMMSVPMALVYVVAQFLGAFIGFGALVLLTPPAIFRPDPTASTGSCSTVPIESLTAMQALALEFIATTFLITLCCASWDPRNAKEQDSIAIKFGLAVAALSISIGPATGCSMNPARTMAPAIWNNDWTMHWIYWVGPMSASLITTLLYQCIFAAQPETPKKLDNVHS